MSKRDQNIKVSCSLSESYLKRMKNELSVHKGLPVELFITFNSAIRELFKENHKIRRAIWRKKYHRAAKIEPIISTWTPSTTGNRYVNR